MAKRSRRTTRSSDRACNNDRSLRLARSRDEGELRIAEQTSKPG
jgi:hypothetical protein